MSAWPPSLPQRLLGLMESCLTLSLRQLEQARRSGVRGLAPDMARLRRLAGLLRRLGG